MQTLFSRHQQQLANLTDQLQLRHALRSRLNPCLSTKAQQALLDAYIEGDTLHLLTTNASWASRFRLSSRQLIQACSDDRVNKLDVHISAQKEATSRLEKPIARIQPSDEALGKLTQLSNQLNPNDELSLALKQLIQQFKSAQ